MSVCLHFVQFGIGFKKEKDVVYFYCDPNDNRV